MPFLEAQGTEDQHAMWLKPAKEYRILGAYAQTELGHGSNVRGLETTATYDGESDEFVLETPREEARKWWPGNLAKTATHAIVMARLVVGEDDHGVHPFMVRVRDQESHRVVDGVELGDIGGKLGMNAVDNGYMVFHAHRIPRFNLLARHASLDRNGVYTKPKHAKVAYAGMISVRASLISNAGSMLARAATIATRYALQRRQFNYANPKARPEEETPILDYTMHAYRVLPQIATAYALRFTGQWMAELHDALVVQMGDNDFSLLAEVHSAAAGLKSLTTSLAGDGIEALRKSCGGVGFLLASGLPDLFAGYVGVETAEGENFLLTQQTARSLLKSLQAHVSDPEGNTLQGTSAYLARALGQGSGGTAWAPESVEGVMDLDALVDAFEARAVSIVVAAAQELQAKIGGGMPYAEAWVSAQVEAFRMSRAHSFVLVVSNFARKVQDLEASGACEPEVVSVLRSMAQLFALYWMELHMGEFLESGYVSLDQAGYVRSAVRDLLVVLRGEAVRLVDAFGFADFTLASAVGCYDGRVYERLIESTSHEPLNRTRAGEATPGFDAYLKPMLVLKSRM